MTQNVNLDKGLFFSSGGTISSPTSLKYLPLQILVGYTPGGLNPFNMATFHCLFGVHYTQVTILWIPIVPPHHTKFL